MICPWILAVFSSPRILNINKESRICMTLSTMTYYHIQCWINKFKLIGEIFINPLPLVSLGSLNIII